MYQVSTGENKSEISFSRGKLHIDGKPFEGDLSQLDDRRFHLIQNNRSFRVEVLWMDDQRKNFRFRINDVIVETSIQDKMDLLLERLGMDDLAQDTVNDITAPMPGLILDIQVKEGDEVKKGDPVIILEAMKMENVIKASGDGVVGEVKVKKGDSVEKNQILVRF